MNNEWEQSSNSSECQEYNDVLLPTSQMINQYNNQYSMIVQQVKHFLKQIRENVQKFVAFHNFGANLNLSALLFTLTQNQNKFTQKCQLVDKTMTPKDRAKNRYQTSFNKIMEKISVLLQEMIDCELQFKKQFFGMKVQDKQSNSKPRSRRTSFQQQNVVSLTNSSKSVKLQQRVQEQRKSKQHEAELRKALNAKLKPTPTELQLECKQKYSTTENLYRLNEKIDRMVGNMRECRNRQEKLIELFDLNRVKKISSAYRQVTPLLFSSDSQHNNNASTSQQSQFDDILQSYRSVRKKSDSYTENGMIKHANFSKKNTNEAFLIPQ